MSEYVTVEVEFSEDPDVVDLYINQTLTEQSTKNITPIPSKAISALRSRRCFLGPLMASKR